MAKYEVIIKDPITEDIWEIQPENYAFTEKLNEEPTATFNMSFEEVKAMATTNGTTVLNIFTAALREIYITRDDLKIFYGVVSEFGVTPGDNGDKKLSIKAMGFLGLFKKRIVGKGTETVYTATDVADIIWDMVNNSQGADAPYSSWGITRGAHPASKNRDRSYLFDNLYDEIIRLTNNNLKDGIDVDIDNSKQINVYTPTKGIVRDTVVLDERTLEDWKYQKNLFSEMVNDVWVLGEGVNEDVNFERKTADVAYRTPFGTLEEKLDARNTTEAGTLQDKGDRRLLDGRDPVVYLDGLKHFDNPELIAYDDYNLGDTVTVDFPDFDIDSLARRVIEKTFTMQSPQSIALISLKIK